MTPYHGNSSALTDPLRDTQLRTAAFDWLAARVAEQGDVLPRTLLAQGFDFQGERIPLVAPQGIFRPRTMELPLSITSTPNGPYHDSIKPDGLLAYRYRGENPQHPDNVGLRRLMNLRLPLVYLLGIVPGKYLAVWPVYIVHDDPAALTFTVVADAATVVLSAASDLHGAARERSDETDSDILRRYVTQEVRVRLHQRTFRERVLRAYRTQCAMCRLKHAELLDAAHITGDSHPAGEPVIPNGIALCKLHHSAFDANIIGIDTGYEIHVREDILIEVDGPMLTAGLQQMHGQQLILPRSEAHWPDMKRLKEKYEKFRRAG